MSVGDSAHHGTNALYRSWNIETTDKTERLSINILLLV